MAFDLRSFTPTLCHLLGIELPKLSTETRYLEAAKGQATRALLYCPDAFGFHALRQRPDLHARLQDSSTDEIELLSVFPPKTPVCFASLFTGARPDQHGITSYEKPVLTCPTLFDALVRAEKKTAIVAVKDSSIDKIFRNRAIDYFSVDYDPLVTAKALDLLREGHHDVIVVYHQEYDDLLHETEPFSALALKALEHHVDTWELLTEEAKRAWKKDYIVSFTPDHGGHLDPATGHGDHGDDRADDMQLRHFFVRA
jgi:hypothetical protein